MNFEFFIAIRHLTKRRYSGFISMNFLISMLGVAVGVMALIVVLAVMSGFDRELKTKIVGVQPHLVVEKTNGVDRPEAVTKRIEGLGLREIVSVAPFVSGQGIIRSDSFATGVIIRGVDPMRENLLLFQKSMRTGLLKFDDAVIQNEALFGNEETKSIGRIVIGEELAGLLGVHAGDYVSVISPAQDDKSFLAKFRRPKSYPFLVAGIFRLGMNDYDSSIALVSVSQGQSLYRLGDSVSGISIRLQDVEQAEHLKDVVRAGLGSEYLVQSWVDMNRNFFSALKVEKAVMTILLSLIIMVAAFNIVSSLTMVVMEKTKDIGILRSVGCSTQSIAAIFLFEGLTIGVCGVIVGAILGLLLTINLNPFRDFLENTFGISLFPSDVYFFDKIPTQINPNDIVWIIGAALVMALVAGLYPAYQAARLKPVEALRCE